MKILDLVLKAKWYDMITSGVKHEEYRDIKPFWIKRLLGVNDEVANFYSRPENEKKLIDALENGELSLNGYTHIRFRRAYTKTSVVYPIKSFSIGQGKWNWGASNKNLFILSLEDNNTTEILNGIVNSAIQEGAIELSKTNKIALKTLGDKIADNIRKRFGDDNLDFTVEGNLKNFKLVPANEHTKLFLLKLT